MRRLVSSFHIKPEVNTSVCWPYHVRTLDADYSLMSSYYKGYVKKSQVISKRKACFQNESMPGKKKSTFFAEISKPQAGRRLVFPLFAQRSDNQHNNGDQIGDHLDEVGHIARHRDVQQRWQKLIQPVEQAEQIRTPDCVKRLPGRKDDQRDGQPAQRFDLCGGCPNTLVVIQYVIQTAETRNTGTQTGGPVFVFGDADTGGICRCWVFIR